METAIVLSGVLGLGYLFNKENNDDLNENVKEEMVGDLDIYNSYRSYNIRDNEQERADKLFEKAKHFPHSNVMVPGPPKTEQFNKVDYSNRNLPLEFEEIGGIANVRDNQVKDAQFVGVSLSGQPMNKESFVHNNMAPFFGSHVSQNVDEYANQTKLENFTGTIQNYRQKTEVPTMFKPERNVSNPYGMQSLDERTRDRYIVGNIRNNETPIEKVYVGPGLNKGYTSQPSGGFQQSNGRDYVLPKTTNQIRVKTNPKLSYQGRIISGKHIGRPAKEGRVTKHLPDRFYINTPDRLFTTVGACTGPKQRGKVLLRNTERRTKSKNKYAGPAGPATSGSTQPIRSKVRQSCRQQLAKPQLGAASAGDKWGIFGKLFDYGRAAFKNKVTMRSTTDIGERFGNPNAVTHLQAKVPINRNLRPTRKTNVVGNAHWSGNIQGPHNRHTVYDPNDRPKTTIKETNIQNNHKGNVRAIFSKPRVPLIQKAKNTIRQTTLRGYFTNAQGDNQGGYKNMRYKARNTNRQFQQKEYIGGAGNGSLEQPASQTAAYNMTVKSLREKIAKGRTPGAQSQKYVIDSKDVNMTTNKHVDSNNVAIQQRGVAPSKVYNSLPQAEHCGVSKNKMTVSNRELANRLDPGTLEGLDSNPYTFRGGKK